MSIDWNNKEEVCEALEKNGYALEYASPRLQDDDEIVLAAVSNAGYALEYASPRLQDDDKIVLTAVSNAPGALRYASSRLQDNEEIVLLAVSKDGYLLRFASPRLKDNDEIVLAAVSDAGKALEYASPRLQDDKRVVLGVVSDSKYGLKFASSRMQDDEEVVLAAINNNVFQLEHASERLRNKKEIALLVLDICEEEEFERIMENAIGEKLKNSKEFIEKAIDIWGVAINCVGDKLSQDEEFMRQSRLKIVSENPYMVSRLSNISNDIEVAKQVIMEDGELIKFFSDEIKGNTEIASMVLKKFPESIIYFPENLHKDEEFISSCNLDTETLQEVQAYIKLKNEKSIGGAILEQGPFEDEIYTIIEPREVKTFAKQACYSPDDGSIYLCSTIYEGEKTSVGDACHNNCGYNQGIMVLVYSGDLSVEQNLELLSKYNAMNPISFENFLEYHERDLKKCIGIENYYEYILVFNEKYYESREETIQAVINKIERNLEDGKYTYEGELAYLRCELEKESQHASEEIVEGISPREGEIQEVLNETITEQSRTEDINLEKLGEEQGDN